MKATLCFTALEFLILVLQSAAMGGILVLMILTGANVPRLLIGAATLALVLAKVVTGMRRGKLAENCASGISRTDR